MNWNERGDWPALYVQGIRSQHRRNGQRNSSDRPVDLNSPKISQKFRDKDKWDAYTPGFFSTIFEFDDRIALSALNLFDVLKDELSVLETIGFKRSFDSLLRMGWWWWRRLWLGQTAWWASPWAHRHGITSATTTWDFPFRFVEFNPPGVNYTFVQNRNSLIQDGLETYMEREEVLFVWVHWSTKNIPMRCWMKATVRDRSQCTILDLWHLTHKIPNVDSTYQILSKINFQ